MGLLSGVELLGKQLLSFINFCPKAQPRHQPHPNHHHRRDNKQPNIHLACHDTPKHVQNRGSHKYRQHQPHKPRQTHDNFHHRACGRTLYRAYHYWQKAVVVTDAPIYFKTMMICCAIPSATIITPTQPFSEYTKRHSKHITDGRSWRANVVAECLGDLLGS